MFNIALRLVGTAVGITAGTVGAAYVYGFAIAAVGNAFYRGFEHAEKTLGK